MTQHGPISVLMDDEQSFSHFYKNKIAIGQGGRIRFVFQRTTINLPAISEKTSRNGKFADCLNKEHEQSHSHFCKNESLSTETTGSVKCFSGRQEVFQLFLQIRIHIGRDFRIRFVFQRTKSSLLAISAETNRYLPRRQEPITSSYQNP